MEQISMFPDILTVNVGSGVIELHATKEKVKRIPKEFEGIKSGKLISFPGNNTSNSERTAEREQKVYPIRKYEDILSMANWLYLNKDRKYALAFILGCNVGLRANELLKLKYDQIFDTEGNVRYKEDLMDTSDVIYIYQGKTDKHRPIFLNDACKDALEWFFPNRSSYYHSSRFLFPSREGGHIEVDTFRKVLKEAAMACGVKENIGTHTLRKTFGHHLWMEDPDVRTDVTLIQSIYGHSDPRITMRYLGLDIYEFKKAYRKLKLNIVKDPAFSGNTK